MGFQAASRACYILWSTWSVAFSPRGAPGSCAWPLSRSPCPSPALLSPLRGPDMHQGQTGDIDYSGQSLVEETKVCKNNNTNMGCTNCVFFYGQLLFLYRFLAYEDEGA